MTTLGSPHLHLRRTDSTNARARALAIAGAPHGTLVTATEQSAGRGRQGRTWSAPAGSALLMSLVLRDPPELLPLVAAVAVARTVGDHAQIKWPNDVHVDGRKVAGILAEGRPQEGWAVLGVGLNVAVSIADLPEELHATATTMGLAASEVPAVRDRLLTELAQALTSTTAEILETWRERDALAGRLEVELPGGGHTALDAGEVHLRQVD